MTAESGSSTRTGLTGRIARRSARHPWWVVGLWVVLLVVGGILAANVNSILTNDAEPANNPDSARATDLIEARLRGPERAREVVVVSSDTLTIDDPAFRERVDGVLAELRGLDGIVESATSYYESGDATLVSDDRRTTLLPVTLAGDFDTALDNVDPLLDVLDEADGRDGFTVVTGGDASIYAALSESEENDLRTGEAIGVPVALLILFLVFGALVAAGIPLVLAIFSIAIATGIAFLIGQAYELSTLVTSMMSMIGLAVGIDYALFIVGRFREERRNRLDKLDAIGRAADTAGKAVFFSGLTVVTALLGLLVVPSSIFRSLGIGAIIVVVVAVTATLTLLPAVLSLLGDRVNRGRLPWMRRESAAEGAFWARVARGVMRRPVISVVTVTTALVLLAVPYFTIDMGLAGIGILPDDTTPSRAFTVLDREFSAGLIEPTEIVVDAPNVDAPAVRGGIDRLVATLSADPDFSSPTVETNASGDLALITVAVDGDPDSERALAAIDRLRDTYAPDAFAGSGADVYVGGTTAETADLVQMVNDYTPWVFALVLSVTFVLLLLAFRSIVVPAKAIVMNLLSVGAAYGAVVAVFQHGWGAGLLGFNQVERVEAWLPLMLFTILFGLSMDYHVFLLSRVRERYDETGDNAASVEHGVRTTARMITGAAAIMVAVFSGFAMGDLVTLQQIGFGLAFAILLDATVVRVVLVPASMRLLGDWNWYLPRWLDWLPHVSIEGTRLPPLAPEPAQAGD
jgi:RND superfamily putative drug exporter